MRPAFTCGADEIGLVNEARLPAGVTLSSPGEAPATEFAARAKAAWARLIRKVSLERRQDA
jgi:hypothetical protein